MPVLGLLVLSWAAWVERPGENRGDMLERIGGWGGKTQKENGKNNREKKKQKKRRKKGQKNLWRES